MAGLALTSAGQVTAKPAVALIDPAGGGPSAPVTGVLQCVPFARANSGIRLYGDAHTWWRQAEGKYARGIAPRPGAVMAIRPHGGSSLGHVAMVNRVVDARTILVSHANWSAPGKIERNVTVVDVSPSNDWSQVRVWYAPIANLGGAHWPVAGFIYNARPGSVRKTALIDKPSPVVKPTKLGSQGTLTRFVPSRTVKVRFGNEPNLAIKAPPLSGQRKRTVKLATSLDGAIQRTARPGSRRDPIGAIITRAR